MSTITTILGLLLITLGLVTRGLSESPGLTIYIPVAIGGIFVILGLLARRDGLRRHAMHGAALLALIAIGGSVRGLMQLPALLSGGDVARPLAVVAQAILAGLCLVFLILAIRSFVVARIARRSAAQLSSGSVRP